MAIADPISDIERWIFEFLKAATRLPVLAVGAAKAAADSEPATDPFFGSAIRELLLNVMTIA